MPLLTNLNVAPYHDDFDKSKNYHRILFKPSIAIQAREMTQVQDILQTQIERLSDSIYYHGSVVKGGQQFYDKSLYSVAVQNTYSNVVVTESLANVTGFYAVGRSSNNVGKIRIVQPRDPVGPNYILYKPAASTGGDPRFEDNEIIDIYTDFANTSTYVATVQAAVTNSFGYGSTFSISESIYYINGHFVQAPSQEAVVNTTTLSTNVVIGYYVSENIVTALQDESLYDNSLGYPNNLAEGADRLQINLTLGIANVDAVTTNTFVVVATIYEGQIFTDNINPQYSVLGDTLARRTYETSGDFTTTPFTLNLKDVPNISNYLQATISAGTAFVQGYEYTFLSPLKVNIPKARTTDSVINSFINSSYGSYTKVKNLKGQLPNINTGQAVELHSVAPASANSSTKVGTANFRSLDYFSGSGSAAVYEASLFNFSFNPLAGGITKVVYNSYGPITGATYTGTASGYTNGDLLVVTRTADSPSNGTVNTTLQITTNSSGGGLTFAVTGGATVLWPSGNVVTGLQYTNSTGGSTVTGSGANFIAQAAYVNGYSNSDTIIVASPAAGGNATIQLVTNSTGGDLKFSITDPGFGFTNNDVTYAMDISGVTGSNAEFTIFAAAGSGLGGAFANVRSLVVPSPSGSYTSPTLSMEIDASAFDTAKIGTINSIYVTGTTSGYSNTDYVVVYSQYGNAYGDITTNTAGGITNITVTDGGVGFKANTTFNSSSNNYVKVLSSSGGNSAGTGGTFFANSLASNSAQLYEAASDLMVFPLGHKNVANSMNVGYTYRKVFKNVSFISGNSTIGTSSSADSFYGEQGSFIPSTEVVAYYAVVATSTSGTITAGNFVPLDRPNAGVYIPVVEGSAFSTAKIMLGDNSFNGTADVIATIRTSSDVRKAKNIQLNSTKAFTAISPGQTKSLGIADIYALKGVYDIGTSTFQGAWSNAISYSISAAVLSGSVVYKSQIGSNINNDISNTAAWLPANTITYNFTFDNGQRNAFYDHGSITYRGNTVTGNTVAVFDYFTHTGGRGYFSVDSYPVDYSEIPSYVTSSGQTLQLRDCYDFRPRRTDNAATYTFDTYQLPARSALSYVSSDHSYYLGRIDKIILTKDGKFYIKSGKPAYVTPQYPSDDANGMTMFVLSVPPYTYKASDVRVQTIPHKRYTMQQLGTIDQRLTSVEYYTALTMGEQQLHSQTIAASNGVTLFKNGYLVDAFAGHNIGEVTNPDYQCSIDYTNNFLRPSFDFDFVPYDVSSAAGNANFWVSNNTLMLAYTEIPIFKQTAITKEEEHCNPFEIFWHKFIPCHLPLRDRDHCFDWRWHPWCDRNERGCNNNWIRHPRCYHTEWNFWHTCWRGQSPSSIFAKDIANMREGDYGRDQTLAQLQANYDYINGHPELYGDTYEWQSAKNDAWTKVINFREPDGDRTTVIQQASNTGVFFPPGDPRTTTEYEQNGKVYNSSIKFYAMKGNIIEFDCFGLAPLTIHHVFCNDLFVTGHCEWWDHDNSIWTDFHHDLLTDRYGRLKCRFHVPAIQYFRFYGEQYLMFHICDNMFHYHGATSWCRQKYWLKPQPPDYDEFEEDDFDFGSVFTDGGPDGSLNETPQEVDAPAGSLYLLVDGQRADVTTETSYTSTEIVEINTLYDHCRRHFWDLCNDIRVWQHFTHDDLWEIHHCFRRVFHRHPCIGEYMHHLRRHYVHGISWVTMEAELTKHYNAYLVNKNNRANQFNPYAVQLYVDPKLYPNGVYVTSVQLAVTEIDEYEGIHIHFRPFWLFGGRWCPHPYRHHRHSHCWLHPFHIKKFNIYDIENTMTKFTFNEPVYLAPDTKHAFVIQSNSKKHKFHTNTIGEIDFLTGRRCERPHWHGPCYKPCLATVWKEEETTIVTITINAANFIPSAQITFPSYAVDSDLPFFLMVPQSDDTVIPGVTSVVHEVQVKNSSSNTMDSWISVSPNLNHDFGAAKIISANTPTDSLTRLTLQTKDKFVTPKVSLPKLSSIYVSNLINSISDPALINKPETLPYGGGALAKYCTTPVKLVSGISATSLRVWLDLNLMSGTNVEIYYKVLNSYDNTPFGERPWTKMPEPLGGWHYATNNRDFHEHAWELDDITYQSNDSTYPDFETFSIKVVMYSDNEAIVPMCQNLRVIAAS